MQRVGPYGLEWKLRDRRLVRTGLMERYGRYRHPWKVPGELDFRVWRMKGEVKDS